MTLFKKKSTSLSGKLKRAIDSISVDVFGYEKMISQNIIKHTTYYAKCLNIPVEKLQLKIHLKPDKEGSVVSAFLYNERTAKLIIPTEDLAYFFMNAGTIQLMNKENKVTHGIKKYLNVFALTHQINEASIVIWISNKDNSIAINAFEKQKFIKKISLHSLIKYFKK